jgi:hypothetical protein
MTRQRTDNCEELRKALAAAKARLHEAPMRSTLDLEAGDIEVAMHIDERDALNAEIDRIEQALHQNGCH